MAGVASSSALLRRLVLVTSIVAAMSGPAWAGSVTLAWDPNSESDLAGYVVSWGTEPGVYTASQDVSKAASAVVANLEPGTRYYFAVRAYNTSGMFSGYSTEVQAAIPQTGQAPTLTSVSPANGSVKGGTAVTLVGSRFAAGAKVRFGGVVASAVTVLDATTITAVTPAHTAGSVDVVVEVAGVTPAGLTRGFSYLKKTAKGAQPASARESGGTTVTISGEGFEPDAVVTFDGVAARVLSSSDSTLIVTAPPHESGTVDLLVSDASGTDVTGALRFTYVGNDSSTDADGDGLPDAWENDYGLDPADATGDNGAAGDPDHDGASNTTELDAATHPRGLVKRYFAEGVSTAFFTTMFAIANPGDTTAVVVMQFFDDTGESATHPLILAPRARTTVNPATIPGFSDAAFSTTIEANELIVADRTVGWDPTGYGGHAETAIEAPSTLWYFAEGATHSGFDLFYLLQNPGTTEARVRIRYLRPAGDPIVKSYVIAPHTRYNIWVDLEDARLSGTDVSAEVSSDVPIIAERSMYSNGGNLAFGAGHNSAGITTTSTSWFLAEGATGDYFDTFVLIANPTVTTAQVTASYLLPDGRTVEKQYQVLPNSRFNIWVDLEDPLLADTPLSTTIESTNEVPLIVERTMWWPKIGPGGWIEAHNAPGTTATATRWALADGEVGGSQNRATYILVANTSAHAGDVRVTLLLENGTSLAREFPLAARSRFNVDVAWAFPAAAGKRFGALIESLGANPVQTVVERAMYWDARGVSWAAGTDAVATRLPSPPVSATEMTAQD
jgi:hypothetical protein